MFDCPTAACRAIWSASLGVQSLMSYLARKAFQLSLDRRTIRKGGCCLYCSSAIQTYLQRLSIGKPTNGSNPGGLELSLVRDTRDTQTVTKRTAPHQWEIGGLTKCMNHSGNMSKLYIPNLRSSSIRFSAILCIAVALLLARWRIRFSRYTTGRGLVPLGGIHFNAYVVRWSLHYP